MKKILFRLLIPLALLGLAAVGVRVIFLAAPGSAQSQQRAQSLPVKVFEARPQTVPTVVETTGLVVPAKQVTMTPQVSGRVVQRPAELVPGGRLTEGELIARVDPSDYRLALAMEQSQIVSAKLQLRTERGRQGVARREWELLGGEQSPDEEAPPLALRQPHVAASKAGLDAAQAKARRARLNLARTTIEAPWNAVIAEINVEEGQVVSPGTKLARLIGSDQLWVRVSVTLADLDRLDVPGVGAGQGSEARVIQSLGEGRTVTRQGRVLRLESELDPQTRLAQLLVAVDDPFDEPAGAIPLLPGSYVSVELIGEQLEGVVAVPRQAVRRGDTLWLVDDSGRLASRQVEVRWGDDDHYYVGGLEPGEQVVTTNLSLPVAGTEVSVVRNETEAGEGS